MGILLWLPLSFFFWGEIDAWGLAKSGKAIAGQAGYIVGATNLTNCTCVDQTLCNSADIITDGSGMINLRRSCIPGQVCCVHPTSSTSNPTPSPLTGCGVGIATTTGLLGSSGPRSGPFSVRITTDSTTAAIGEFPWMVAIIESGSGRFICGGSLVDEKVVLTAAHCVAGKAPSSLIARVGEWDASTDTEKYKSQDLGTSSVIVHPNFYPPGVFNDIALLILSSPADISQPHIGVSCMPEASDTFMLNGCTVIGWGKETFNSPDISAILKKTRVPIVAHPTCQTSLQNAKLGSRFRLHESFLCAGGQTNQDACTGDGGGPLMCPHGREQGRWIQVGVVSWGLECGLNVPGVYADVQRAGPWIQENINKATLTFTPA